MSFIYKTNEIPKLTEINKKIWIFFYYYLLLYIMRVANKIEDEDLLLKKFNNREPDAFGMIYSMFYNELQLFTKNLYRSTNEQSSDAIQDVFLSLWRNENKFDKLINIKAYLYISIRNNFRSYLNHNKYVIEHQKYSLMDSDMFEIDVLKSELYSAMYEILKIIPEDSADILRLFLNGFNADEIANKLGKNKQTIYNKKTEAISILKNKLSKDKLFLLSLFLYELK